MNLSKLFEDIKNRRISQVQIAGDNSVQIGVQNNYFTKKQPSTDGSELAIKRKEYTEYILEHKRNVMKAFYTYLFVIPSNIHVDATALYFKCKNHDVSKFSREEFEPYRIHFFPTRNEDPNSKENLEAFDKAWKHHFISNSHHPEFFFEETNNCIIQKGNMDDFSIVEMILDWIAMGYKFNNTAYEYYKQHEKEINKKLLTFEVISKVRMTLDAIKNKDEEEKEY